MNIRVLVCGGRNYNDAQTVNKVLGQLNSERPISAVIYGGCTGADSCGFWWAIRNFINAEEYKADWRKHGNSAGPIRNQRMIDEGKPDLVVAFPGGTGTADMVRRARKAGIEVMEIE